MKVQVINSGAADLRVTTLTGGVTIGYVRSLDSSVFDSADGVQLRNAGTNALLFSATFTNDVSIYVPKTGAIQGFASYTSSSSASVGSGFVPVVDSADITAAVLISWFFLWAVMKGLSRK